MALFVHGVLLLWLVVVPCACLTRFPIHRVLIVALVLGLLFLPMVNEGLTGSDIGPFGAILIPGLALTKYKVLSLSLLLAVLLADGKRLLEARLSWVDIPMILWCLCPIPSVFGGEPPPENNPALSVALSQVFANFLLWGVPYFVGKLYFGTLERLRELAIAFVFGAVLYIPFCLFEVRMSPQLHSMVYGFHQHEFQQTIRYDGYRPMVFMQHGLALGLFMTLATLVGAILWWTGAWRHIPGTFWKKYPYLFPLLLAALLITTVLTRSSGAWVIGLIGFLVVCSAFLLRIPWSVAALVLVCPLYLWARIGGSWTAAALMPVMLGTMGQDRADSFMFRQEQEELLMVRAAEGPPFGWAGWGRNFHQDKEGRNITIPDSLWIITLGERGIPGLVLLFLALLLPVVCFLIFQPAVLWSHPELAGATACALVLVLYMLDNLMNAMHNQVFILMAGALAALPPTKVPKPPLPPSITDRAVFRWSLNLARLRRENSSTSGQSNP